MPKPKHPAGSDSRGVMDYYEYKRLHELKRMRRRAVELTGDAEPPEPQTEPEPHAAPADKLLGRIRGGLKRAADAGQQPEAEDLSHEHVRAMGVDVEAAPVDPSEPSAQEGREDEPGQGAEAIQPPKHPQQPTGAAGRAEERVSRRAARAAHKQAEPAQPVEPQDESESNRPDGLDAEPPEATGSGIGELLEQLDEPEADELEITNPFAGTLERLKFLGGKIRQLTEKSTQARDTNPFATEADIDEEDLPKPEKPIIRTGGRGMRIRRLAKPAADEPEDAVDSDDDVPSRRRNRAIARRQESIIDDDPLGVIRPADEETHRAFMRPEAAQARNEAVDGTSGAKESPAIAREDQFMNDNKPAKADLTRKLMDELNGVPALSRRERKAMANVGTLSKPAAKPQPYDEDELEGVDEPTQQFKPLRARPVRSESPVQPVYVEDDEDDDDDIRPRPSRLVSRIGKQRVYRDEDLDDEYEDDHDDYDDDEDDYDDYDDDDYDDDEYDDDYDEEYDRRHRQSFGKRVLGWLKGLLILIIVVLLVVVALRQLEASNVISLNFLRETVGQVLPIDAVFPAPSEQPTDIPVVEVTPEPESTEASDDLLLNAQDDEPSETLEPEGTKALPDDGDPGIEGVPLESDDFDGANESEPDATPMSTPDDGTDVPVIA